ncbi:MAG: hypothetical protein AAF203_06845, partial [Pseudomonadota bacterium]
MIRLFASLTAIVLLAGCGSDGGGPAGPPPELVAFDFWVEETPQAMDSVLALSEMGEVAEKAGDVPTFFKYGSLMTREERDNVQNGYLYPLYFANPTRDYPGRFWNDGYTVKKSRVSGDYEARRNQAIRADMIIFWGRENYDNLFFSLNNYGLIDVRYYSIKIAPPLVAETCFTVRWETGEDGTFNFCYPGHRFMRDTNGNFPPVQWAYNNRQNGDEVEAYKLFVLGLA